MSETKSNVDLVFGLSISHAARIMKKSFDNPFGWRYQAMDNLAYATPFEWKQSAKLGSQ